MGLFLEEIVNTYQTGEIKSSFSNEQIKDIVFTSLAQTNRFNGITKVPYCTMTHSFAVGKLAYDYATIYHNYQQHTKDKIKLFGYMHDMGETIIGDVVYPLKSGDFKKNVKTFEDIERAFLIFLGEKVFGIKNFQNEYEYFYPLIKKADDYLGLLELIGISKNTSGFESSVFFADANLFRWGLTQLGFKMEFEGLLEKVLKEQSKDEKRKI